MNNRQLGPRPLEQVPTPSNAPLAAGSAEIAARRPKSWRPRSPHGSHAVPPPSNSFPRLLIGGQASHVTLLFQRRCPALGPQSDWSEGPSLSGRHCYACSLRADWPRRTVLRHRGRSRREGPDWIGRCQNEGRSLLAGRLGGEGRVFSALRTGAEEAAVAPGAFERAHPSPRANAEPGPTGGTAPDSPRGFLAAMEDGVYGRSARGGAG